MRYGLPYADDGGRTLWRTNETDALGSVVEYELGHGAVTRHTYDTATHRLKRIVTTKNLQSLAYDYDKFGNLAARKDIKARMEESFTYDSMDRLTGITLKRRTWQDLHCSVSYDALGRMTSRQAVTAVNGTPSVETLFSTPSFDATKVHAMTQAQASPSFPSEGMEVTYTGFDKVSRVRQGGDSLRYTYGFDRERIRMEEFRPEETRTKDYVRSCEFITKTTLRESTTRSLTFVSGPCGVFAVVEREGGAERTHYVHKDHLGSWTVITDEDGVVEQTLSYDAWGCLRDPATWANHSAPGDFEPMFGRGFTGHEHLSRFGLVNMDGRMYDPFTASFLSADRFVQDPSSAQGFNRYAYCMHNPLRYVDPTGYYVTYSGHGHDPDGPLKQVIIYGVSGFLIPETTITPDGNPPTTTDWTEFKFEPYYNTGGGGDLHYGFDNDSPPTIGPDNGSGGGGNGGKKQNISLAATTLATLWVASIAEPTPVGETVSTATTLAATIYYGIELVPKMLDEISNLTTRQDGPDGFVYELRANTDGMYPCYNGTQPVVYLDAGDIWKIGETTRGENRYSDNWMLSIGEGGVTMQRVYFGNQRQIKIQEKIMIYGYYFRHGHLPPGNKIFR